MLDRKGFDLWAGDYDRQVGLSDESGTYPFAGYRAALGMVYDAVLSAGARTLLDIGFGTGVLTSALYDRGLSVWGQDFSEKMISIAGEKMPQARLYAGDFSRGPVPELKCRRYDAIVATYSLHHLTDGEKAEFIRSLQPLLSENGRIYIADIAFPDNASLDACRENAGDAWDGDEHYFVFERFKKDFPSAEFYPLSHCAGVIVI